MVAKVKWVMTLEVPVTAHGNSNDACLCNCSLFFAQIVPSLAFSQTVEIVDRNLSGHRVFLPLPVSETEIKPWIPAPIFTPLHVLLPWKQRARALFCVTTKIPSIRTKYCQCFCIFWIQCLGLGGVDNPTCKTKLDHHDHYHPTLNATGISNDHALVAKC